MGQSFYYIICFRANGRSTLLWYSNILLMIISNLIAAINTAIVEVEGVGTFTIINILTFRRVRRCSRERERGLVDMTEECSPYNNMAGFVLNKFYMQLSESMTKIPKLFCQQKLVKKQLEFCFVFHIKTMLKSVCHTH